MTRGRKKLEFDEGKCISLLNQDGVDVNAKRKASLALYRYYRGASVNKVNEA